MTGHSVLEKAFEDAQRTIESLRAEVESMRTLLRHAGAREDAYITTIREQVELIRLLEEGVPNVA